MVSTDLEVCAKVAKESRSEYTTPLARAARLIECPRRTANRSTKNYTSRFLLPLPLPGGRVSKAKQNIPIAKPCVYTSTGFFGEFHVLHWFFSTQGHSFHAGIGTNSGSDYHFSDLDIVTDSGQRAGWRSEEHTSELQSLAYLVCRLLLEKKKNTKF